jgi:hypothetical protein
MDTASQVKTARRKANNACSQRARELKKRNHALVLRICQDFEVKTCGRADSVEAYQFAVRIRELLTESARGETLSLADIESMPTVADDVYNGADLFPLL